LRRPPAPSSYGRRGERYALENGYSLAKRDSSNESTLNPRNVFLGRKSRSARQDNSD
jgi:hypothetical protein